MTSQENVCLERAVACSRRSDSRAQEKNSRRNKKRGETRGGKPPLPRFPGVQLNSLPTYRLCLLSERRNRLSEQATNKHVNGSLGERASPPLILPSSLPIFSRFLVFPSSYIIRLAINSVFNQSPARTTLGGVCVSSIMTKLLP